MAKNQKVTSPSLANSPFTQQFRHTANQHTPLNPFVAAASSNSSADDILELDDSFTDIVCSSNLMSIAGFGSLLSQTSALTTFPDLVNFRLAKVKGWRRVFAHSCQVFFDRGIARPETKEISSLSVEPHPDSEIAVTVFEIPATPHSIAAFIEREHEFKFMAVEPICFHTNHSLRRSAVICGANTDANYKATRCPPDEWERRYGRYNIGTLWHDPAVLPCRTYLRHCVLAAKKLGAEVEDNFLDNTLLSDRKTSIREHLERNPEIMMEEPPPSLVGRYSG
jgi:hypothetical protein